MPSNHPTAEKLVDADFLDQDAENVEVVGDVETTYW